MEVERLSPDSDRSWSGPDVNMSGPREPDVNMSGQSGLTEIKYVGLLGCHVHVPYESEKRDGTATETSGL